MNAMNQVTLPTNGFSSLWQSPGERFPTAAQFGQSERPGFSPSKLRRCASIAVAIAIQAAFVTALVSAMGVKIPARLAPMMVVDIDPRPVVKLEPPPPPLRLESPKIAMTLPTMPEVIMELPPPATAPKTAISIAAPDTIPFDTRASGEKYETVMLRYINSHLRYPPIARARHQQGTVYVRFVIDRQGHVLSAAVEKSSRVAALDEEGLALLERAQPLPAPPAEIVGDHIQLVVPINFLLR